MAQKVFVTKNGKANVSCPKCGIVKPMDVSRFQALNKEVRLKCTCSCKHVFPIQLERRQHIRKTVNLRGELYYKNKSTHVVIVDVSRLGIKIKTRNPLQLEIGNKVVLKFILDDVGKSRVTKEAEIKSITSATMGLAFSSTDHYDKFGHYILFQSR